MEEPSWHAWPEMSLGWKRFNFYDHQARPDAAVPASSTCSCSSDSQVLLGDESGLVSLRLRLPCRGSTICLYCSADTSYTCQVTILDRALSKEHSFQAHPGAIRQLQLVEVQAHELQPSLHCSAFGWLST